MENWTTIRAADFVEFNPRLSIKKGAVATRIAMDKLQPFTKKIPATERAEFAGGSKFCNGDTIMARITPCLENGKTAFVDILAEGEVAFGSTEFIVMRAKAGVSDPQFIYYLATSPMFRNVAIKSMVGSSGRQRVQQGVLDELELMVPPLEEQRKIGVFLASLDQKIALNNEINDNLLEQLDALYQELSARATWSIVPIGDLADKVAMGPFGSNIKVSTFVASGVPIISGNHLRGYFLEEPSYNYITEEHAEKLKNSVVYSGDIIFTHAGNIGQVALIPDECDYSRYVLSQRQFYLRCNKEKVLPEYVTLFFHSAEGQHELLSFANQTGVPSLAQPASNLKKITLPVPPIQIQEEWAALVRPLISYYQRNRLESRELAILRDTLLPKLMSGEIDVSNIGN